MAFGDILSSGSMNIKQGRVNVNMAGHHHRIFCSGSAFYWFDTRQNSPDTNFIIWKSSGSFTGSWEIIYAWTASLDLPGNWQLAGQHENYLYGVGVDIDGVVMGADTLNYYFLEYDCNTDSGSMELLQSTSQTNPDSIVNWDNGAANFISLMAIHKNGDITIVRPGTEASSMGNKYGRTVWDKRRDGVWTKSQTWTIGGDAYNVYPTWENKAFIRFNDDGDIYFGNLHDDTDTTAATGDAFQFHVISSGSDTLSTYNHTGSIGSSGFDRIWVVDYELYGAPSQSDFQQSYEITWFPHAPHTDQTSFWPGVLYGLKADGPGGVPTNQPVNIENGLNIPFNPFNYADHSFYWSESYYRFTSDSTTGGLQLWSASFVNGTGSISSRLELDVPSNFTASWGLSATYPHVKEDNSVVVYVVGVTGSSTWDFVNLDGDSPYIVEVSFDMDTGGPALIISGTVPASMSLATFDPTTVFGSITITPTPAPVDTTTFDPIVVLGSVSITPSSVSVVMDTVDPSVATPFVFSPTPASMSLATSDPSVVYGTLAVTTTPAAVDLQTSDPISVLGSINITPTVIAVDLSTVDPSVATPFTFTPSPAAVSLATSDPSIVFGSLTLTTTAAAVDLQTSDPTPVLGTITFTPSAVAVDLATSDPSVATPLTFTPSPAAVSLDTVDPTISADIILTPGVASMVMESNGPVVVQGSVTVIPSPSPVVLVTEDGIYIGGLSPSTIVGVSSIDNIESISF